jgi:uncharacterized protein
MGTIEFLKDRREVILRIAGKHGALNVRIFGSVARGEADETSDIDFLVDMGPNRSPFFPGGLIVELEEYLGRKVDVITENGLRERIRERVLKEAVPL